MTKENLMALADEYATLTADTAAVTKARAALEAALNGVCIDAARYRFIADNAIVETDAFEYNGRYLYAKKKDLDCLVDETLDKME